MSSAYINNIEYSRSLQEKYEYYQAGLNFTLLAASVQTAKFSIDKIPAIFELSGWVLLLLAGVIALLRFRMQPVAHKAYAELQLKEKALQNFKAGHAQNTKEVLWSDTGEIMPIETAIEELNASLERNKPKVQNLERKLMSQHAWHTWLFIIGFVFILIARAYVPLVNILCS